MFLFLLGILSQSCCAVLVSAALMHMASVGSHDLQEPCEWGSAGNSSNTPTLAVHQQGNTVVSTATQSISVQAGNYRQCWLSVSIIIKTTMHIGMCQNSSGREVVTGIGVGYAWAQPLRLQGTASRHKIQTNDGVVRAKKETNKQNWAA